VNADGIEAPADWPSLQSLETYAGAAQTQNFVGLRNGRAHSIPAQLKLNQWALQGDWSIGKEAVVLNATNGRIVYRFHARDLHLVMSPPTPGNAVRFRVSIDRQPPGSAHGIDIDTAGYGTLSEPRLYQLIRQPTSITNRQFEIEFLDRGAEVFAFTFG
jgi:thioredoxin family protein